MTAPTPDTIRCSPSKSHCATRFNRWSNVRLTTVNRQCRQRPQSLTCRTSCSHRDALVCRASGGLFGGLRKALQGTEKPQQSQDTVEFPPCRYSPPCCKTRFKNLASSKPYMLTSQQYLGCITHSADTFCRLLKSTKDYELRIYDVYPFATTPYERRDEGFLALGSYMEGRNSESARMNLTQPIVMRYEPATVSTLL